MTLGVMAVIALVIYFWFKRKRILWFKFYLQLFG
jgi:hypothetical protein